MNKSKISIPENNRVINDMPRGDTRKCGEEKEKKEFGMIPFEDRQLVRKHGGLGLQDYWLDCWEVDPYGSRYVLMPDSDLKSSTHRKYRKQLKQLGLFLFEIRQDGKNYQLWILNRHGSRVNSYWEGNKTLHRRGDGIVEGGDGIVERGDGIVEGGDGIVEGGDGIVERGDGIVEVKPGTQSQSDLQERSGSFHDLFKIFLISLSTAERENFEKFIREEWRKRTTKPGQPGEEIISMERFLGKEEDCRNWYTLFLQSPAGKEAKKQASAAKYDWRNDPRFDDWIWKAWDGGYPWTQADEVEREERYAFWQWAQDTNAYEGVCYQ